MASIKLKGDTSGEITISAPAVAGTNTLTIPAVTGNVLTDGAALPAIDGSALTNLPAPAALSTASGSAPSYSARAWVSWQGQGTVSINASGNVSSITDNGTGDYTINFTTAMPDANYCYTSSGKETSSNNNRSDLIVTARASDTMLAGSARMTTANASNAGIFDAYTACVAFFR